MEREAFHNFIFLHIVYRLRELLVGTHLCKSCVSMLITFKGMAPATTAASGVEGAALEEDEDEAHVAP